MTWHDMIWHDEMRWWDEMPWPYKTRNSEFRILNVHIDPELVMCHLEWWESGQDPATLWEGRLWNIWKVFKENGTVAVSGMLAKRAVTRREESQRKRSSGDGALWLESSQLWETLKVYSLFCATAHLLLKGEKGFVFKKNQIFFYVLVFHLHIVVCTVHMPGTCQGQKRSLDPLEPCSC